MNCKIIVILLLLFYFIILYVWVSGFVIFHDISIIFKASKGAKIRNRYYQVPHMTYDTNGKATNSQLHVDTTNESQEASPFPAGDNKAQTRAKRPALTQQVTTRHNLTDAHKDIANTRQKKNP